MRIQHDIHERMRAILIDWLVDVHLKFALRDETLYLAINILDRYLEKKEVSKSKLQLVGTTAMLIASKYEEIRPPLIKDFIYVTDNTYSKSDILLMESSILSALTFDLTFSSSFLFLSRYNEIGMNEPNSRFMYFARYMLELSLLEYRMLKYSPTMQAAAAMYLAYKVLGRVPAWNNYYADYTGYSEKQLRMCARDMCALVKGIESSPLAAVRKKYSSKKFLEVAKIKFPM